MAKLMIYLGNVLEREVALRAGARIGRGADNDIVLPDATHSVSRHHAEVRFEQNRYTIVDTNSQNGLWVEGRRVSNTLLAPGTPVLIGPYKILLLDEPRPVEQDPDATVVIRSSTAADAKTIIRKSTTVPARPPAKVEAVPTPAAPEMKTPKPAMPPAPKPELNTARPPAVTVPPNAAPKPLAPPAPAPPAAVTPASDAKLATDGIAKALMLGGLAAALMAANVAACLFVPSLNPFHLSTGHRETTTASTTPASAPSGGNSEPTVRATPPPTVETPPTTAPTPKTPPPAAPTAQTPTKAAAPTPASSNGESTQARPQVPPRRVDLAPSKPRVEKEKPPNLPSMLERARFAMINRDYLAAIGDLEAILKQDPNYPEAEGLLNVARSGALNASRLAIDLGNQAELKGDYATALKEYERALTFDPGSRAATDAIRRLKARMKGDGEEHFRRAQAFHSQGKKEEAIAGYEKALQLLPPDHPSAALARDALVILKGGE